jgi:hypothetical protein
MWAELTKDEKLTVHVSIPTLEELQAAVGGYVEVRELKNGVTMWLNEEGKIDWTGLGGSATRDELENVKATYLFVHRGVVPVRAGDFIAGNVAFTGGPDRRGDTTGLSEEGLAMIRHAVNNIAVIRVGAR